MQLKIPPNKIYLQFHGDSPNDLLDDEVNLEDITWSRSQVFNSDVIYCKELELNRFRDLIKESIEYLDTHKETSIGSGSILHMKFKAAIGDN